MNIQTNYAYSNCRYSNLAKLAFKANPLTNDSAFEQKYHTPNEKFYTFNHCTQIGNMNDYIRSTSRIKDLYDYISINKKASQVDESGNVLLIKEANTNFIPYIYRLFGVDSNGEKTLMGSIVEDYGGKASFYNTSGDEIGGFFKSEIDNTPMIQVNDSTMHVKVQNMKRRPGANIGVLSEITMLNSNGQFNIFHTNILDNLVNLVKCIIGGDNDVDTDRIINAYKYQDFKDITPTALKGSGLLISNPLGGDKFTVKRNLFMPTKRYTLSIDNDYITGTVPLFENNNIDIFEGSPSLSIKMNPLWCEPPVYAYETNDIFSIKQQVALKHNVLDMRSKMFMKAVCRYLTELNKVITANNVNRNYSSAAKNLIIH